MIRVLLADDHQLVRMGLRVLVDREEDMRLTRFDPDVDRTSRCAVFDCVAHDVADRGSERVGVTGNRRHGRIAHDSNDDAALPRIRLCIAQNVAHDVGERDVRRRATRRVGHDAGELEHPLDHVRQTPTFTAYHGPVLSNLITVGHDTVGQVFAG